MKICVQDPLAQHHDRRDEEYSQVPRPHYLFQVSPTSGEKSEKEEIHKVYSNRQHASLIPTSFGRRILHFHLVHFLPPGSKAPPHIHT